MPDPFVALGVAVASKAMPGMWDALMKRIVSANDESELFGALVEAVDVIVCLKKSYDNTIKRHPLKVPSDTFWNWVAMVEKIEEVVESLQQKRAKTSSKKAFLKRPGLMDEMKKVAERISNLKQVGDQLEGKLFLGYKIKPVILKNATPDIKRFDTLKEPLEEILVLLEDDRVYTIGICGPLGIGKTSIMETLNNLEEVANSFDVVIWVNVSTEGKEESSKRIQQLICQRLKLDLEVDGEPDDVKTSISVALSETKYLLLLDDVKEPPDLEEMGIFPNKNGSKVVLTTRLHYVCSSAVDIKIKVSYLSSDEAWKMFRDVLKQPKLVEDPRKARVAWRVCKECSGLPLLVKIVASTFRLMNSEQDWDDGLKSWRMWPEKERQGIEELFNMFKFCYDALDDDHQKKCFLYGALYPEDSEIFSDFLLECWEAEDLLGEHKNKFKLAHQVLTRLKNVSLLEEGNTENHVTMHKFIRQVALYILESDSELQYLVKTNGVPWEPQQWLEKHRISLGDNDVCKLPESPECKELYTLFLQKNSGLEEIPESFFEYMENLLVLDLSDTGIVSLPSSLLLLIKLKILYLNNCKALKSLPPDIIRLELLEALDLRGSGIVNIPVNIGDLINLRRLRLSFLKNENADATQGNQFNIISKLSGLEELGIDLKTPDQWSKEVVGNIVDAVAPLEKFKALKFFFPDKVVDCIDAGPVTLHIHVPDSTTLLSFLEKSRWRNVKSIKEFRFYISVETAERPELVNFMKYQRYVKYCNGDLGSFPTKVLCVADAFEIVNHKDMKELSEIEKGSMNSLQACLVERCDAFETVVNGTNEGVLPNLEHLYLKNLPKLRSICDGSLQSGSLTRIKTLALIGCHILTQILPSGVIDELCRIEHLIVEDCPEIEELFSSAGSPDVLPKLKKLELRDLEKLKLIFEVNTLKLASLEKLKISGCPQLSKLPFNKVNNTKLKAIKAEKQWWDSLEWQDEKDKDLYEVSVL